MKAEIKQKRSCEIVLCASYHTDRRFIYVDENIEDASFNTRICRTCADVLGIKKGQDIPDNAKTLLRKFRKLNPSAAHIKFKEDFEAVGVILESRLGGVAERIRNKKFPKREQSTNI